MPRKPRFYLPGVPAHVVQRGNARQAVFFCSADYEAYLEWLVEGAEHHSCALHAYVLMTNHVHLLMTPRHADSVSRTIQHVGRKYVPYINRQRRRTGTLWEGRHKGSVVHSESYALACYRYIEMNPVRAGMVRAPADYLWSSYRANALGAGSNWLTASPEYLRLGTDEHERRAAYRGLFDNNTDPAEIKMIRDCTQTGTPLGHSLFREGVAASTGQQVGQERRGRPPRKTRVKGTDPF
jgi:putative transposase